MKPATAPSALEVQAVLGPEFQVLEFEASTRVAVSDPPGLTPWAKRLLEQWYQTQRV